jgi:hypothetical protein
MFTLDVATAQLASGHFLKLTFRKSPKQPVSSSCAWTGAICRLNHRHSGDPPA